MSIMVDWLSGSIPVYTGKDFFDGMIAEVDREGTPIWHSYKTAPIRGSHSSSFYLTCQTTRHGVKQLRFSGNPAKFIQGHNCFGPSDPQLLLSIVLPDLFRRLGVWCDESIASVKMGNVRLSRIDVTGSFETGSYQSAADWLHSAKGYFSTSHQKISVEDEGVYFGKHSRRRSGKIYHKGSEILKPKHGPSLSISEKHRELLKQWASDKIRIEFCLRSNYLNEFTYSNEKGFQKKTQYLLENPNIKLLDSRYIDQAVPGLEWLYNWKNIDLNLMHRKLIEEKIYISEGAMYAEKTKYNLPIAAFRTFQMWEQGLDPRGHLKKATFYRHKKQIKDILAIDISLPNPNLNPDFAPVIPLVRIIEASTVPIPEWAYQNQLIAA